MSPYVDESMISDMTGISRVYRLLSRLLIAEMDTELFKRLSRSPLPKPLIEIGGWLPRSLSPQVEEELSSDYCQLFLGPSGHLPPYQSVWQHGQFESQVTESMQKYRDLARFTPTTMKARVMLDHLGIQMELMGHILEQLSAANSLADRESILEFAAAFSNDHLQWPESLLRAAEENARTKFYRSNLKLIRLFLDSEKIFWAEVSAG